MARSLCAAIIGGLAGLAIAGCASSGAEADSAHHGVAALLGYRWQVEHLHDQSGTLAVARARRAEIGFTKDGYVLGNDTQNGVQGRYRSTSDGYAVTDFAGGLVGGTGGDPEATRIIAGIDTMFVSVSTSLASSSPVSVGVRVNLHGDTLVLTRGTTSVTLVRAGIQPNFVGPTGPSQTPSAS
jgi:hypothetical protein